MTGLDRRTVHHAAIILMLAVGAGGCGPHRGRPSPAPATVLTAAPAPSAQPRTPLLRRPQAVAVARRFAAAYTAWDAGDRRPMTMRRLQAASTPTLLAELRAVAAARPTSARPRGGRAAPVAAYRWSDGRYSVAFDIGAPNRRYAFTLVVVRAPAGPRVAQIDR